jgi:hypothetical protein
MLLKLGSSGEDVKQLQEFLKINADGKFGPATELKVRAWQILNGLLPDGVVGDNTWNKMAIATTDLSENLDRVDQNIEIKRLYMPTSEYLVGPTKKEWLFLHHTAGWQDPYNVISCWSKDNRGPVGTEFVLGGQSVKGDDVKQDGVIVQAFPKGSYGWHLGVGNSFMHRNSVGVEVCSFGQVTKGGYQKDGDWIDLQPNTFYNYVGTEVVPEQIVKLKKPFRGYSHCHAYSDKQLNSLKKLILYVGERDGIDVKQGLIGLIKTKGVDAFDVTDVKMCEKTKGMWCHTNVQRGKVDLFPQEKLIDMLLSL